MAGATGAGAAYVVASSTLTSGRATMGFRFRRSVKILPGVRLNVSKSGVSTTIGRRGASVNIGKRGTHVNVGIPGTGLSYRERIAPPTTKSQATDAPQASGAGAVVLVIACLLLFALCAA